MYRKQKTKKPEIDIFSIHNCRYIFFKKGNPRSQMILRNQSINQSAAQGTLTSLPVTRGADAQKPSKILSNIWVTGSWQHIIRGIATSLFKAFYCTETFKNKYFDESPDNY